MNWLNYSAESELSCLITKNDGFWIPISTAWRMNSPSHLCARRIDFTRASPPARAHSKCAARCTPANRIIHSRSERKQKHISLTLRIENEFISAEREGVPRELKFQLHRFESHLELSAVQLPEHTREYNNMQPSAASKTARSHSPKELFCIYRVYSKWHCSRRVVASEQQQPAPFVKRDPSRRYHPGRHQEQPLGAPPLACCWCWLRVKQYFIDMRIAHYRRASISKLWICLF